MADDNRATVDPVTLEVVRHKLEGIANEMESTLLRSSFSPIVKEGLDASASLFTTDGESLAQAIAVPIHLATLIPCVQRILQTYALEQMRDGDVFIMNDPYLGGTHLPDIALVMPVFHEGRPIALSATMTHHQDVGGMTPGSVPTTATEIFQEGIRIPPLKFRDAGELNSTLIALLRLNVRLPDTFMGDLNAQLAACTIGARRVVELADRYGADPLADIAAALLRRSEQLTRLAIEAIPDGRYHYVDYLDNDGIELDKPVRIETTVHVQDDSVLIDFAGTAAQLKGPFNCVPSGAQAAAWFAMHALTDPEIPTNSGCFRPIELRLPEGSLVNPRCPAPVNSRTATIKRITGCIIGALRQALPERAPADAASELLVLAFAGERRDGSRYIVGELIASGSGASADKDGVDVIETDGSNCMNLPVEALEMDAPIRVLCSRLRTDSGGPGRQRGGLGIQRVYEILHGEVSFTHRGERHDHPARGAQGGGDGQTARSVITRVDGTEEVIHSKLVTVLHPGDRVEVTTAGGGGYGPAGERDRRALSEDLRNGKVRDAGIYAGPGAPDTRRQGRTEREAS
ncbi:MAG: hydantoinase B/oxoprolinase family protein [Gammaproteobacteria bacterium]|nr:hydantoinase B/oxoprolinase family protein [Gammaproteobacteria bacterium]